MNKLLQIVGIVLLIIFSTKPEIYGQTAGTVTSGNWYRIAYNTGNRANAEFTLRDFISSGGHSTVNFRIGISYNYEAGTSFTLLNHNYYRTITFSKIRLLHKGTYDAQYLEVFVNRSGSVNFSIYDNLQSTGWKTVAWQLGSVPPGYEIMEWGVNKLFSVANETKELSFDRSGNLIVNGQIYLPQNGTQSNKIRFRAQSSDNSYLFSEVFDGGTGTRLVIQKNDDANDYIHFNHRHWKYGISDIMSLWRDKIQMFQPVSIGTTNYNSNYLLQVGGTIRAKEVKVETGWSDFVFEPDYELKPLGQIEDFINENGHLPDIPSAKEVEENGISLGEMDAKLLQKIEELTLYVIEQNRKLEMQSNELKAQSQKLKEVSGKNKNLSEAFVELKKENEEMKRENKAQDLEIKELKK